MERSQWGRKKKDSKRKWKNLIYYKIAETNSNSINPFKTRKRCILFIIVFFENVTKKKKNCHNRKSDREIYSAFSKDGFLSVEYKTLHTHLELMQDKRFDSFDLIRLCARVTLSNVILYYLVKFLHFL